MKKDLASNAKNLAEGTKGSPLMTAPYLIRDEIERDLSAPHSVRELAERFNTNITSLNESFRSAYGQTIPAYIRQRRMEKAADLIMEGEFAITRIAVQVGYANPSKFSEAFKRFFGMTPSEYRNARKVKSSIDTPHS